MKYKVQKSEKQKFKNPGQTLSLLLIIAFFCFFFGGILVCMFYLIFVFISG